MSFVVYLLASLGGALSYIIWEIRTAPTREQFKVDWSIVWFILWGWPFALLALIAIKITECDWSSAERLLKRVGDVTYNLFKKRE